MICNKKRTIWTFSLLLGLLLAVGTGTVIGHRETALWKARAGEAFGQALAREIGRRDVDTVYFSGTVGNPYRACEHSDTGSVSWRYIRCRRTRCTGVGMKGWQTGGFPAGRASC